MGGRWEEEAQRARWLFTNRFKSIFQYFHNWYSSASGDRLNVSPAFNQNPFPSQPPRLRLLRTSRDEPRTHGACKSELALCFDTIQRCSALLCLRPLPYRAVHSDPSPSGPPAAPPTTGPGPPSCSQVTV